MSQPSATTRSKLPNAAERALPYLVLRDRGHTETTERADEINGETDGDAIWLMRRLGDGLLLNTLLHEALHDSVFVERATRSGLRRTLSESDEHAIMEIVGLLADD